MSGASQLCLPYSSCKHGRGYPTLILESSNPMDRGVQHQARGDLPPIFSPWIMRLSPVLGSPTLHLQSHSHQRKKRLRPAEPCERSRTASVTLKVFCWTLKMVSANSSTAKKKSKNWLNAPGANGCASRYGPSVMNPTGPCRSSFVSAVVVDSRVDACHVPARAHIDKSLPALR